MGHHVFIDPLPPDFTSEELKVLLEQFGSAMRSSVAYDSIGESLRFGYVEMETEQSADTACKCLNRTLFRGARLTVLRAPELDAAA
jgi:RNA recognition motif-containing protein